MASGRMVSTTIAQVAPSLDSRHIGTALLEIGMNYCSEHFGKIFKGRQAGVGESGGTETTLHQARVTVQEHVGESDYGMLVLDWTNGYSEANRQTILQETRRHAPQILRWPNWALTSPFQMVMKPRTLPDGTSQPVILEATRGTKQGDPLSSFWFGLNVQPVIHHIHEQWGEHLDVHRWIIEDGILNHSTY